MNGDDERMSAPTIGSLFSGYGGLDLAVDLVFPGATVRWVSDIEEGPKRVLAYRYPDAPNLGDITAIDWATVEPVDIITGGSPCQDLSHAGKRAGMRDGKMQLSPRFEEWMTMLPDGWFTDPAIWADMKPSTARNAQVRLAGNGVVPPQAAEAIRWCLATWECAA